MKNNKILTSKKGFTLLELMISIGILAIGIFISFNLVETVLFQSNLQKKYVYALSIASSNLEEEKSLYLNNHTKFDNSKMPLKITKSDQTFEGQTYKASIIYELPESSSSVNIADEGNNDQVLKIISKVNWGNSSEISLSTYVTLR